MVKIEHMFGGTMNNTKTLVVEWLVEEIERKNGIIRNGGILKVKGQYSIICSQLPETLNFPSGYSYCKYRGIIHGTDGTAYEMYTPDGERWEVTLF